MRLSFRLNGKQVETDVRPDMLLLDLVRDLGCYSVKRGCETANWRPLYCMAGRKAGSVMFYTCDPGRWPPCDYTGRSAERGRRIWYVFSKRRRRAVRFLQSRIYYERSCYGKRVKRSR